jgi:hypothetical protein
MSTQLQLGETVAGHPFRLPLELVTQTAAVVGIRGSGKTVTATVEVEEALKAGVPVVVIDPTDVWWGLKSSADGEAAGYPVVIFGGTHGDLPLSADSGRTIADFVVEQRVPVILSLRHLRKGQQREFVTGFAEQLYFRKGEPKHRTPLLVAIDEASTFVPQRVAGDTARLVGAIQDLVRLGRSSGFGVILIDQRPASVNKDVLTQLEVLVAHRITSPQDRKALLEWIQQHDTEGHRATFLEQLASLPQGHAWFWSPALDVFELIHVRMRRTFDSSRTPKLGEVLEPPRAWAEIDITELRSRMEEAIAEAEANDPKELRGRIAELEQELAKSQAEISTDPDELKAAVEAATASLRAELAEERAWLDMIRERAQEIIQLATREIHVSALPADTQHAAPGKIRHDVPAPGHNPPAPPAPPAAGEQLPTPQQRILDALATYRAFGQEEVDVTAAAMLAGYRPGTGHFNNTRGAMNSAGLITYPRPGFIALTAEGLRHAAPKRIGSLEELHAAWMEVLEGPQRRILQVLLDAYPDALTTDQLAAAAGFSPNTGHFNNTRGSLRTLGAVEYPQRGYGRASDLLFPEGLR